MLSHPTCMLCPTSMLKKSVSLKSYSITPPIPSLSEVKFSDRKKALKEKARVQKEILPFVTQYNPSVPNLEQILMEKWKSFHSLVLVLVLMLASYV